MNYLSIPTPAKTIMIGSPPELEQKIRTSVFSGLITNNPAPDDNKIIYQIRQQNDKYYLYRNRRLTHRNRNSHKIIYALEWQIVNDFLNAYKNCIKFHAAALSYKNRGALFIGHSGTGKTSLSLVLMKSEWQLLSDEFGILDAANLTIQPFLRNIIIKPHHPIDSARKERFLNTVYQTDKKRLEIHYFPPSEFGLLRNKSTPLKQIYYLKNSDSSNFSIKRLKQYEALPLLLNHLQNPDILKTTLFDFTSSVFNDIRHFELHLPNPFTLSEKQQAKLRTQLAGGF